MCKRSLAAILVLLGAVSSPDAHGKSAKEVFSEVSSGIVVVTALNPLGKETAQGSGVVVSRNHVATDCRIVSGSERVAVRRAADALGRKNARMMARLTAHEPERDLCLLFVAGLSDAPAALPVPLGSARDVSVGDEVYAIAAAQGLELSLSRGIVSRLRGSDGRNEAPVIHTDAAVLPSFSGGGLFDLQGRLIGIIALNGHGASAAAGGFSPALPVDWVTELTRTVEAPETRLAELRVLYNQAQEALSAAQDATRQAREQVRLRNLQIAALRQQLARIEAALEASERKVEEQNGRIVNLSQRLNAALAINAREFAAFRSEFFGRLRKALGNRSDVRIVGDRFIFQSEVLFASGKATLQHAGRVQIDKLAKTLKEIARKIPRDIDWVLRVDGHTDRLPIATPAFPSNWELSTGRAIAVVRRLIERGVPATRLAATGFGEFQPIDRGSTIAAFKRNRRIEFKLIQR